MIDFIEEHKEAIGVEPICKILPLSSSSFYASKAVKQNPDLACNRAKQDIIDCEDIQRVYDDNRQVYGARKIWHALRREGKDIARCTVERLMKTMNIQGVVRGKKVITTIPDKALPCPKDKVNRQFKADRPNQLWISDFTYVSSWQGTIYVAFIVDVFARKIVGWKVSTSMTTVFVLDALEQAICQRRPNGNLIHHSDRGSQYLSIKYTERLIDAGIEPSVGSVGDSYDNAMAESIIGLFKTEVIKQKSSWKNMGEVGWATLKWVHWYNTDRLLEPLGYIPPNEPEENYYKNINNPSYG